MWVLAEMPAAPQPPVAPAVIAAVLTAAMQTVETSNIETPAAVPMEEIADAAMEIAAVKAMLRVTKGSGHHELLNC